MCPPPLPAVSKSNPAHPSGTPLTEEPQDSGLHLSQSKRGSVSTPVGLIPPACAYRLD